MICTFYNTDDDPKKILKFLYDSEQTTCDIVNNTDIINPTIVVKSKYISKNYVYLNDLHRYYFVNNITIANGMIVMELSIDVLYTYKDEILNSSQHILRVEDYKTTDKPDGLIETTATTIQHSKKVSDALITNNINFLLGVR